LSQLPTVNVDQPHVRHLYGVNTRMNGSLRAIVAERPKVHGVAAWSPPTLFPGMALGESPAPVDLVPGHPGRRRSALGLGGPLESPP